MKVSSIISWMNCEQQNEGIDGNVTLRKPLKRDVYEFLTRSKRLQILKTFLKTLFLYSTTLKTDGQEK